MAGGSSTHLFLRSQVPWIVNRVIRANEGNRNERTEKQNSMKTKILILTCALGASTCLLTAQDGDQRPEGPRPPGRDGGPGGPRMPNPIIEALDLNKDGTIDADELLKAGHSLKKLDKNGDGKITPDEYRPQRPGGPGGEGRPPRRAVEQ